MATGMQMDTSEGWESKRSATFRFACDDSCKKNNESERWIGKKKINYLFLFKILPTFRMCDFLKTVVACESERCISLGFPTFRCVHLYNCRHLPPEFGDASAAECSPRPGAYNRATSRLTDWLGVQTGLSPHTHRFLIKFGTKDAPGSHLKGVPLGASAGLRKRVRVARVTRCRTPER